jgi:hypothetical protein
MVTTALHLLNDLSRVDQGGPLDDGSLFATMPRKIGGDREAGRYQPVTVHGA